MKQSKITLLTSIGAGLEYYDLIIYGLLANFIGHQFFPSSNHVASLFATFGVFALSNIIRPLGGVILGVFGDRFGRKKIFTNTLLWMAFATFTMGIIPSFAKIGLVATILFSLCRLIQGLVFGAEFPGAVTLLSEHIDKEKHGIHFGFMISTVSIGVSLGSFVTWILTKILTESEMMAWGFRLPFLLGGSLAIVGFYIRRRLPETPKFLALQKSRAVITPTVIKSHLGQVFNVIGILLFPACLVTFKLIFPVYLRDFYHFDLSDIYLATTLGYIWSAVLKPIFGWISDKIGRKVIIIVAGIIVIIGFLPIFLWLQSGNRLALFSFLLFAQTTTASMAASYFVLLPQAFQTVIRYTGVGFSYNVAYTIAALTPLGVNYIYGILKNPMYLVWAFISLAALTVMSTLIFKVKED
ncbi:MAG: MFS transporter [Coxiellaceae bacterium]|jgi:MHS family proline/betaine transporter-like MFS transporter|nr:MFS transporter [Coxiellaceae bacterium]